MSSYRHRWALSVGQQAVAWRGRWIPAAQTRLCRRAQRAELDRAFARPQATSGAADVGLFTFWRAVAPRRS